MRWRRRRRRRAPRPLILVALYGDVPDGLDETRIADVGVKAPDRQEFSWGPAAGTGRIDGITAWSPRHGRSQKIPFDRDVYIAPSDTVSVTVPIRLP